MIASNGAFYHEKNPKFEEMKSLKLKCWQKQKKKKKKKK
jgi:hypothetical protein